MHPIDKGDTQHDAHRDGANEKNKKIPPAFRRDLSESDQEIPDEEIAEPPENIHGGRRQSFPGRSGERTRKGITRDAMHKMGNGVCEEHTSEEAREEVIPFHRDLHG